MRVIIVSPRLNEKLLSVFLSRRLPSGRPAQSPGNDVYMAPIKDSDQIRYICLMLFVVNLCSFQKSTHQTLL